MGRKTSIGLLKIQTFAKNGNLVEHRQQQTREQCLQKWQVPDQLRSPPDRFEAPRDALKRILSVCEARSTVKDNFR